MINKKNGNTMEKKLMSQLQKMELALLDMNLNMNSDIDTKLEGIYEKDSIKQEVRSTFEGIFGDLPMGDDSYTKFKDIWNIGMDN